MKAKKASDPFIYEPPNVGEIHNLNEAAISPAPLKTITFMYLEVINLTTLADQRAPGILVTLHSQTGIEGQVQHRVFPCGLCKTELVCAAIGNLTK